MELGGVFDDRKAQAGSADLSGVALVHAVEAFEDPLLFVGGDADAVVLDGQAGPVSLLPDPDRDFSALPVVFDGIVAEIVDHLVDQVGGSRDADGLVRSSGLSVRPGLSLHMDRHPALPGGRFKCLCGIPGGLQEVNFLNLSRDSSLVQFGQADDVVDQSDHPLALPVDISRELDHFFLIAQAALHQFRESADRGQRGLELVGDIGGKLPAHAFSLLRLLFDRPPLVLQSFQEGIQLRVDVRVGEVIQIHSVDRQGDRVGNAEGRDGRDDKDQEDPAQDRRDRQQGLPDGPHGPRQAEDRAVPA